jgi:hypothetical protein
VLINTLTAVWSHIRQRTMYVTLIDPYYCVKFSENVRERESRYSG